jgi:hypothetical protein
MTKIRDRLRYVFPRVTHVTVLPVDPYDVFGLPAVVDAIRRCRSRCTPSGSPSFSTSISAAEQCSMTSIKKVRRPLSQLVSSLLSKAIRRTGGPDLRWAFTSLGKGSFWPILQPPASWTSTSPSAGRSMISSHRPVASVLRGSFVPAFVRVKDHSHNGWLCHAAKGRELQQRPHRICISILFLRSLI